MTSSEEERDEDDREVGGGSEKWTDSESAHAARRTRELQGEGRRECVRRR